MGKAVGKKGCNQHLEGHFRPTAARLRSAGLEGLGEKEGYHFLARHTPTTILVIIMSDRVIAKNEYQGSLTWVSSLSSTWMERRASRLSCGFLV